jgi:hypothetical protein
MGQPLRVTDDQLAKAEGHPSQLTVWHPRELAVIYQSSAHCG